MSGKNSVIFCFSSDRTSKNHCGRNQIIRTNLVKCTCIDGLPECDGIWGSTSSKRYRHRHLARLGNCTFPKNGKQRACKIPKIYRALGKMPITSYVRYSAQYVCKTYYTGHRTYGTFHNKDKCQTGYIVR